MKSDEKYMHPNEQAHADWIKILFDDIENTKGKNGNEKSLSTWIQGHSTKDVK